VELFLDDLHGLTNILNKLTPEWDLQRNEHRFDNIDDLKGNIPERTIVVAKILDLILWPGKNQ